MDRLKISRKQNQEAMGMPAMEKPLPLGLWGGLELPHLENGAPP